MSETKVRFDEPCPLNTDGGEHLSTQRFMRRDFDPQVIPKYDRTVLACDCGASTLDFLKRDPPGFPNA